MDDWVTLFGSYLHSGVYTITPGLNVGSIKKAAAACKLDFLQVDLKRVTSKADFLKKVAQALNFPEYFGMNWDALSDCLTDMSWRSASGYVLLFNNFQSFAENAPVDMRVIRHIFDSSVKYWKQKTVPFYIILSEKSPSNP
jgi:RNAse (barnase) inhibitor barstar